MAYTWKPSKSGKTWTLRVGEFTAWMQPLLDGSTRFMIYRKGSGVIRQGYLSTALDWLGVQRQLGVAIALEAAITPQAKRPKLLISVPFGRYKYVGYYLRRKGYVDKFPRRQGDAPLVLGEAGTAVVDEVVRHLKAIAPGVVVV
jgi:hypothetical protein